MKETICLIMIAFFGYDIGFIIADLFNNMSISNILFNLGCLFIDSLLIYFLILDFKFSLRGKLVND